MSTISAAALVDLLRDCRILDATQLEKINRALKGRDPDPRAIARELLKHGWLTAYQANQLLLGHGSELRLSPYLLLDRLGEGGMGQVFKARHQLMNRIVAVKIIRKERLTHPDAVERFHREIRLAAQLDHPNLVRAHDAAQVGDVHFLVMEYAEGADLHRLVHKSGPLPLGQACHYIRQAALGLQYASERGLVHRDIKPSNLQVTAGEVVKILDMGLARSRLPEGNEGGKADLTQAYTIMGTPDYIAPEQIADPRQVDVRADIYSLGCTLYYLLAGWPPFPGGAWEDKLVCHRKVEPKAIELIRPDVPAAFGAVLRKMMAKRPEDRYSSPATVADALAAFCAPGVPTAPGGRTAPLPPTVAYRNAPDTAAAAAASLANQAGAPEPGWSLETDSTFATARMPTLEGQAMKPPPGPTMLLPTQHAGAPSSAAAPRSRKTLWLALASCAFLGTMFLLSIVLVIALWPKDGNADKNSGSAKAAADKDKGKDSTNAPPKADEPVVLVDEDFRSTYEKKLAIPEKWVEGEAYRVIKDNDKCALEVGKPTGLHFVRLPPVLLSGNFYVEGVYMLDRFAHKLTVSLENRAKSALLPIVFNWDGNVLIEKDARLPPPDYVPLKPSHFLLKRQGNRLRVFLDKSPVADKDLEDIAEFDAVRIGLVAGPGNSGRLARLYGIKVGTFSSDGQVPASNMRGPDSGGRPKREKGFGR
ncbi:MAG TPA: serine/threonine-protein kinase [Gemmataceae bacterium]|jgi:tRNA A-37 threonylcarbamoyl transferase component Bud32